MTGERRCLIRVDGIVQGVGFRPFVHRLAHELGLVGHVGNDAQGVFIDVQGAPGAVTALEDALRHRAPPLAVVERLDTVELPLDGATGFGIVDSDADGGHDALISPDVATCDACVRELFDPADRRYRYPFVNCTDCGPRFTIVTGVPYDRPLTTMAGFAMCDRCRAEYDEPADRRFHAQPVCCPACGPQVVLRSGHDDVVGDRAITGAAALLAAGQVLAVKGLGGYHLAALASDESAVAVLRERKHREEKPFAVMCPDLAAVATVVDLDDAATALLTGTARPVVLLPRRPDAAIAVSVAPRNRRLGVFLPYTPLHHLLLREVGRPLVLTSGNYSDEPIASDDADAACRLAGIADAFLVHDRPIHIRADDSVVSMMAGRTVPIRRARGFAPAPVALPVEARRPVLGCGAELKSTFALARGRRAFVSQHIGDLENAETMAAYTAGIAHLRNLFGIDPEVVAHDLHPDYLSSKWALELDGVDVLGVQHHHAHIASCLADNGVSSRVIGVAYDGLGYGTDGTLWGGEILLCDLSSFSRLMHLRPVAMPGGVRAVREPWRMAVSWLLATYGGDIPTGLGVQRRHFSGWAAIASLAQSAMSPMTSSAGRLFDAVAALCDVRDEVVYEGQAAIELEQLVDRDESGHYEIPRHDGLLDATALIGAVVDDLRAGAPASAVAARFHRGLAYATADACAAVAAATGITTVALSGGVFQNAHLLELLTGRLRAEGLDVLTHRTVPPNDGGISLGQVAIAAASTGTHR